MDLFGTKGVSLSYDPQTESYKLLSSYLTIKIPFSYDSHIFPNHINFYPPI